MAHSKYPPSSASRWLKCPKSLEWAKKGIFEPGEAAAKGTILHKITEECARSGKDCSEYNKRKYRQGEFEFVIDNSDLAAVEACLDVVGSFPDGALKYYEYPVVMEKIIPGFFGTADFICVAGSTLAIVDYKFGQVPVYPEHNIQLSCYALGAIQSLKLEGIERVQLSIVQPFAKGGGGTWTASLHEIELLRPVLIEAYERIQRNPDSMCPGFSQCRYCPGLTGGCAAADTYFADTLTDLSGEDIAKPMKAMSESLSNEEIVGIVKNSSTIKKWVDSVYGRAMALLMNGTKIEGLKLVVGRTRPAKWVDEQEAVKVMLDSGISFPYNVNPLTPAAAQKLFKGEASRRFFEAIKDNLKREDAGYSVETADSKKPEAEIAPFWVDED